MIEVCYDSTVGMNCPAMYGAMAANLHLPYWLVTGKGGYKGPMRVDVPQLTTALNAAMETVVAMRTRDHLPDGSRSSSGEEGGGGGVVSLVRRMKRSCGRASGRKKAGGP